MRKLIYSFGVSLDGYIEGPGQEIDWTAPDDELHQFHNDQAREFDVHLYGRRLYEVMVPYWPTADVNPDATAVEVEFSRIWKTTTKIVFSRTLDEVSGDNTRLERGDVADVVRELKAQPGKDIAIGGPTLAASLIPAGLIDEYRLFVYPIVLGAGLPFFPAMATRIGLRLAETRTFGSGVVYLRYVAG